MAQKRTLVRVRELPEALDPEIAELIDCGGGAVGAVPTLDLKYDTEGGGGVS